MKSLQEDFDKEKAKENERRRKAVDKRTQTKSNLTAEKFNQLESKVALRLVPCCPETAS